MISIDNEDFLRKLRHDENSYSIVISHVEGCDMCSEYAKNIEAIEHIFPQIDFIKYEMVEPSDLPVFMSPASPSMFFFINGIKVNEEAGLKTKLEAINKIKEWVQNAI